MNNITSKARGGKPAQSGARPTLRLPKGATAQAAPPFERSPAPSIPATTTNACDPPPTPHAPKPPSAPLTDAYFFFLWAVNSYRPSYRHESVESALAQAKRLRAAHPELELHVFRAVRVDEKAVAP
jgi:hypothetical protein